MIAPTGRIAAEAYPITYRSSGFWRISLLVCSVLAAAGGIVGVGYSLFGQFADAGGRFILSGVCLSFMALGIYMLLWIAKSKVILFPDQISFEGVISTKTFCREELRGWRIRPTSPPTLVLQPKEGRPAFKTSLTFRLDDQFLDWLDAVPSLDREEAAASMSNIQEDERLGATPSERAEALERGKSRAKVLSFLSITACLWAFFYPRPYNLVILALMVLPWGAVEIMRRSHGLFRADKLPNDTHPSAAYALIFPGVMLSLRALLDYDVLQSPLSIALYVAVGGALLVAIAIVDPTQRSRGWTMVIFGFITLAYGYGSVIEANALLDRSTGIAYSAPVKGKQIIDGRSTTYELDLGAWGPKTGTNDLDVGRATYEQIQPGDIALLKLKKGALGVRWYYLSDWQAGDGQTTNK